MQVRPVWLSPRSSCALRLQRPEASSRRSSIPSDANRSTYLAALEQLPGEAFQGLAFKRSKNSHENAAPLPKPSPAP